MSHEKSKEFWAEKGKALGVEPILKPETQPKTTETSNVSPELEKVRIEQKALYEKMKNDQPISRGEWKELARHAKKMASLAPENEQKDFLDISATAETFAK